MQDIKTIGLVDFNALLDFLKSTERFEQGWTEFAGEYRTQHTEDLTVVRLGKKVRIYKRPTDYAAYMKFLNNDQDFLIEIRL